MKKLFLLLFAVAALVSCSKEDDGGFTPAPDAYDKYQNGFYVLNEGKGTASINYYTSGGWKQNIFQANNGDKMLGVTGTVAVCSATNMYVVTKMTPFLVEVALSDFVMKSALSADALPAGVQARSFALLDDKRGVLSTDKGAYVVKLNPLSIEATPFSTQSNDLNGDVIVAGGYIFLLGSARQGNEVMIYDAATLKYVKSAGQATTGFAQAAGTIWAANKTKLVKINPSTLIAEEIALDAGMSVFYNQFAFTPTGLQASAAGDALYFVNASADGYNGRDIYKFTIATSKSVKFFGAPVDQTDPAKPLLFSVYGSGINVNRTTGDLYLVYSRDGWGANFLVTNIYVVDADGKQKSRIPYTSESETVYWFPSMILFR